MVSCMSSTSHVRLGGYLKENNGLCLTPMPWKIPSARAMMFCSLWASANSTDPGPAPELPSSHNRTQTSYGHTLLSETYIPNSSFFLDDSVRKTYRSNVGKTRDGLCNGLEVSVSIQMSTSWLDKQTRGVKGKTYTSCATSNGREQYVNEAINDAKHLAWVPPRVLPPKCLGPNESVDARDLAHRGAPVNANKNTINNAVSLVISSKYHHLYPRVMD